uniref:Helicase-associated domain-containing protein n=1 Tax=Grammatophora oceanica TaxID=210454 RepID=A0A7S1UYY9_9STRA|mmetsp:Transcript_30023/g.44339  ORF Transcript_30023/g.44339 Transcript_30023/m.44339 type:complete len:409 (+) Transcript_30023:109-1335(+)
MSRTGDGPSPTVRHDLMEVSRTQESHHVAPQRRRKRQISTRYAEAGFLVEMDEIGDKKSRDKDDMVDDDDESYQSDFVDNDEENELEDSQEASNGISDAPIDQRVPKRRRRGRDCAWEEKIAELRAYHAKHGNCLIAQKNKEYPCLARWVKKLREKYKKHKEGESTNLNSKRIAELDALGFTWQLRESNSFDVRVSQLVDFRDQHGHMHVPHVYAPNPALGVWVHNMRTFYRCLKQGKWQSGLTPERVKILNDVGFVWERGRSKGRPSSSQRIAELREFKNRHGHVKVPRSYKDGSFHQWLDNQRSKFLHPRRPGDGKTAEALKRAEILADLGVNWAVEVCKVRAQMGAGGGAEGKSSQCVPRSSPRLEIKPPANGGEEGRQSKIVGGSTRDAVEESSDEDDWYTVEV